ncbi:MAG: hypothetical protein IJL18_03335, partial [Synergistaceae bacterium]|nr:hypothetical protein [Synergistaceae bacterium]
TVFDDEAVFDDVDLVLAFTVFDDELLSAFLVFAGAFFFGGDDNSTAIADSSGSDSKTAFTLSSNTFFFTASFFVEADFLTGEI